jgi:hypothetical protein
MMRFEVFDGRYTLACGYCGETDDVGGPFPLGLQTSVSVQEALEWHHMAPANTQAVFESTYQPCRARLTQGERRIDVWRRSRKPRISTSRK